MKLDKKSDPPHIQWKVVEVKLEPYVEADNTDMLPTDPSMYQAAQFFYKTLILSPLKCLIS